MKIFVRNTVIAMYVSPSYIYRKIKKYNYIAKFSFINCLIKLQYEQKSVFHCIQHNDMF